MPSHVDFVITNPNHHLAMIGPVCKWLAGHASCSVRVISLCELRGFSTPREEIREMGGRCVRVLPIKLSKDSMPRRALKRDNNGGPRRNLLRLLVWHGVIRHARQKGVRPALVILPNDSAYPYDRIGHELRRDGTPFVLLQEGIRFELPTVGVGAQYGQGGATAIAAWGKTSANYFRRVGVAEDRIHVVGNPRLDGLRAQDWTGRAQKMAVDLGVSSKIILFVSNPIDQQGFCSTQEKYANFVQFVRSARTFLTKHNYTLIVKLHTGESLPDYQSLIESEGAVGQVIVVKDASLPPLLHMAKAVIVLASTVGLEALIMNRSLGALPVPGHGYVHDYAEEGVACALRADDSLPAQLERLTNGSEDRIATRKAYLENHISNLGSATEAVGQMILALLARR